MIDRIELLGIESWELFWLPVLIWTLASAFVWAAIRSERIPASGRIHLAQAALLSLPTALVFTALRPILAPMEYTVISVPAPASVPSAAGPVSSVAAPVNPVWLTIGLMTLLALVGSLIGLIRLGRSVVDLYRLHGRSSVVRDSDVLARVRHHTRAVGLERDVQVRLAPGLSSPMSSGILLPVIFLPEAEDEHFDMILLHELIHHKRMDPLRMAAAETIRALFFFHPLCHALRGQLSDLVEMDCDAGVLGRGDISTHAYASLLLRYALSRNARVAALQLGSRPPLIIKRIEAMQKSENTLRSHPVAVVLAVILVGAVTLVAACTDSFVGANDGADSSVAAKTSEADGEVFVIAEQMPELIGGLKSLQQNVEYPELARRAGVEGRVYLQFVVDKEGVPSDIVVTRGIGAGADEAAVRALSEMRFEPGRQHGQKVAVKMSLPVTFRLDAESADAPTEATSTGTPKVDADHTTRIYDSFDEVPYDFVVVATSGKRADGRMLTDEEARDLAPAVSGTSIADVVRGGRSNDGYIKDISGNQQTFDESTFIIVKPRE
jgi:TonB family protein